MRFDVNPPPAERHRGRSLQTSNLVSAVGWDELASPTIHAGAGVGRCSGRRWDSRRSAHPTGPPPRSVGATVAAYAAFETAPRGSLRSGSRRRLRRRCTAEGGCATFRFPPFPISNVKNNVRGDCYPTEPSICNSMSRFISTAYSIGSSLTSGSIKPLTIIVLASASESPRLCR